MNQKKDEGLIGNEKIEESIERLLEAPSDETLALVLTVLRRRMQEKGQFVVAVDATPAGLSLLVKEIKGKGKWFIAFTSFEEQMLGNEKVMSTFMADIGQLLDMVLGDETIAGIALNPWHHPLLLDRALIQVIKGNMANA